MKEEKKEVGLEIKKYMGSVLFKSTKTTPKEAVEEAVSEDANLRDADLGGANLGGAYLEDADLRDADFYNAKFYGKGGTIKIKKNQIDDFLKALGIVVEN